VTVHLITRKQKEQIVEDVARELKQAELIIITDYRGLTVSAITNLRRQLREEQCSYRVSKNTLTKLACRKVGLEQLEQFLEGPTAIAYTSADPVGAAKVFLKFAKENEVFSARGGLLAGQLLQPEQLKALGEIPPKEVLLAQVCRGFQAPIYGLVNVLQGNIRNLVYALEAVRVQKESA
jgi:large subunit ribosomal protein L10